MSSSNTILIIGASGKVGSNVLSQLLAITPPLPNIRVSSRDPSAHTFPPSVQVVKADLSDSSSYPALFNNVEKAFLYISPGLLDNPQAFTAAKAAGVKHIVFLSSFTVLAQPPNPLGLRHKAVEDAIIAAGLTYTFLRPGAFFTNSSRQWSHEAKQLGKVSFPLLQSHVVGIADEDTAAVAVVALTSDKLDNQAPLITGPHSLTQQEMLDTISKARVEAGGKPLVIEEIPGEQWKSVMLEKKALPEFVLDMLLENWKKTVGQVQPTSGEFSKITGKPGTTFAQWVKVHLDSFM